MLHIQQVVLVYFFYLPPDSFTKRDELLSYYFVLDRSNFWSQFWEIFRSNIF